MRQLKKIMKEAKQKRRNSTRQLSKQVASKGLVRGKSTVWSQGRRLKAKETSAHHRHVTCSWLEICYAVQKPYCLRMGLLHFFSDECSNFFFLSFFLSFRRIGDFGNFFNGFANTCFDRPEYVCMIKTAPRGTISPQM